jgi:Ca2+-binding RTX toxin-like protein
LGVAWEQAVNENLRLTLNSENTFENVTGGALDDVIVGNMLHNRLLGGNGNDFIAGHGGNDHLDGGAGNDDLSGGIGKDVLVGGKGADILTAGAYEADRVQGFAADDQLKFMEEGVVKKFQVGRKGEIYSLHADNSLWMPLNGVVATWHDTRDFFLAKNGALFRLGMDGGLQRRMSNDVTDLANSARLGTNVVKFIVGDDNRCHHLQGNGEQYIDGVLMWADVRDFALDAQGRLYQLGTNGTLERLTWGVGWTVVETGVRRLAVAANGGIYYLNSSNEVRAEGQVIWAGVKDLAIDSARRVVLLGTNGVLEKQTSDGWAIVDSGVQKLAVALDGGVLYLNAANEVRTDGRVIWAGIKDLAIDSAGRVVLLGTNGVLERRDSAGWTIVDTGVQKLATASDGRVLYLNAANEVRADGQVIWAGVKDFAIDSAGRVVLLGTNGVLERQTNVGWEQVADQVQSIQIGADGTSWTLIRQNARDTWEEVHYVGDGIRGIRNPSTKSIPTSLTDCVGRINATVNGQAFVGSGTLLATGANYIVLTSKHVVEGASRITFTTTQGVGTSYHETIYGVAKVVLHPTLDLAILKLATQVDRTIQGAALPARSGGTPAYGEQVLIVGYGFNGDGVHGEQSGTLGSKRYGFSAVDANQAGLLQYRHDVGESSISRGDSGGPDLRAIKRTLLYGSDAGKAFFVPVIVGVHQDILRPSGEIVKNADGTLETRYGDWTRSVAITKAVETWIYDNSWLFN